MPDVVILGAGPAGIATACVFKAIAQDQSVCVLDNRADTRRTYGLAIAGDAMVDLQAILKKNLRPDNTKDHAQIQDLISFFDKWKGTVQSTPDIERTLAEKTHNLGVRVLRKDEYKEAITPQTLGALLAPEPAHDLTPVQRELHEIFQDSKVVVGADGAHSAV